MKFLPIAQEIPSKLKAKQERDPAPENPTSAWKNYNRGEKRDEILSDLFKRQKSLCAYCEIGLDSEYDQGIGRHIEHILPKSRHHELTFEYSNMLLSCFSTGGETHTFENDPAPISCGHATDKKRNFWNEVLFIKPTDYDCEQYFSFELDGKISPHPELNDEEKQRAQYTIDLLNLNCLRLVRLREDIIVKGYEIINELQNEESALQYFLECEILEFNGKVREFINLRKQHFN